MNGHIIVHLIDYLVRNNVLEGVGDKGYYIPVESLALAKRRYDNQIGCNVVFGKRLQASYGGRERGSRLLGYN